MDGLIRITSSYFCAGVDLENNLVIKAAPIIKYMIGWNSGEVVFYCKFKNWEWRIIK